MSKIPNNKDYDDLFKIYLESSCKGDKKDEEESEEVEVDEEDDVVKEGVWDRTKARASGIKDAMGASSTHMKKAFGGAKGRRSEDVGSKYEKSKAYSIMNSHATKLDKQLSRLVTDATKLGIMDDDQAEEFASDISKQIHNLLKKRGGNKAFSNKGKKNF